MGSATKANAKARPARKARLALVGGKKPQMKAARSVVWSKAREKEFLSVIAETCNVAHACRVTGISDTAAYKRRKTDARFRASWMDAIAAAYQRLELVLLDRAFNGTEKLVKRRDGNDEVMLEYSNQLGLSLLKLHRDSAVEADTSFEPDDIEQLRARLINKLERMQKRDAARSGGGPSGAGEVGAVETKLDKQWRLAAMVKLAARDRNRRAR
ncbi:MAG: hypothetical protein ABIO68_03335 [Sphingomicrobium sp.]